MATDSMDPNVTDTGSDLTKIEGKTTCETASDKEKKIRRAERFGITVNLSEEEKRSSRAERFGTGPEAPKHSEEIKRKARAERFGVPTAAGDEAKKRARLERFSLASKTDLNEEDKRKARALRFSKVAVNSMSINGKEHAQQSTVTAVGGKLSGEA